MRHRLLPLALLALTGMAAAAPAPAPHPALWKVADADTTIYLFGTIHALPKGYRWQDAALARAIARSDALMIEVRLEDPAAIAKALAALAYAPGQPPLAARVPPKLRPALAGLIARSRLPTATLDRMETWAAALTLFSATIGDLGIEAGSGVEQVLQAEFAAARKPIAGLETPEQQLGYLDRLPEPDQRAFLAAVLDDPVESKRQFASMLAAWSRGDVRAIARSFDDEVKATPALRQALLVDRNAAWAKWIATRMARPGTLFVAVGAGHLAGAGSVQAALAATGLKAVRVR